MLISVIIPTYNRATLIRETLQSVLCQTTPELEVIIVDDGSTDETYFVLTDCLSQRVTYIYQENRGAGAARNVGIKAAKGEYVAFVDSDDLWLPQKLELQIDRLLLSGDRWAYCDAELFSTDADQPYRLYSRASYPPQEGYVSRALIRGNFIASPTPIIERTVFERVGLFSESRRHSYAEDWELWLRIAAKHSITFVDKPLARYRQHQSSLTAAQQPGTLHDHRIAVLANAMSFAPDVYGPVYQDALTAEYLLAGRTFYRYGQMHEARRLLAEVLRRSPLTLSAYGFWLASFLGSDFATMLRWLRQHIVLHPTRPHGS